MSKISIKTDFVDGEKLFSQQLNNNFSVIQAGVNANEENLQEVIDQAIEELDAELEAITADRGWDWNGGDRVTFFKGNTSQISGKSITNGQLLYNTDTGETALDDDGTRIVTGSGNVVTVANDAPTNPATKEWIKPVTINGVDTAEEYFRDSSSNWKKILNTPSGDTLPIGTVAEFSGNTAPANWLFCDGQALSRTTYSDLFAVIGTTYGEGDGSTTFNLPDYNALSPTGIEANLDANSIIKITQSVGVLGVITNDISNVNTNAVPNAITVKTYVDNKNNYSENETIVGIDGNDIRYRKVLKGTKEGSSDLVFSAISNFGALKDLKGILNSSEGTKYPIPYGLGDIYTSLQCNSSGVVTLKGSNSPYATGNVEITIEYTKSS